MFLSTVSDDGRGAVGPPTGSTSRPFSVHCREKSATWEAVNLLLPHVPAWEPAEGAAAADGPSFSNLKLSARGLVGLVFKLPGTPGAGEEGRAATAAAVGAYTAAEGHATQQAAPNVQRIVPLASTCALEVEGLRACAARVAAVAAPTLAAAPRPTFGVAVASRGSGEAKQQDAAPPPARAAIIAAVAQGFSAALKEGHGIEAAVDLKAPAVVVAVEVLPLAGRLFAGIGVLPQRVCTLKPRLGMRPLRAGSGGEKAATA